MKRLNAKALMVLATVGTLFASMMVSSACYWGMYQPEEPKCLRD